MGDRLRNRQTPFSPRDSGESACLTITGGAKDDRRPQRSSITLWVEGRFTRPMLTRLQRSLYSSPASSESPIVLA